MTSIAGYDLKSTPCCGATYSTPRYRSMNFMAWEYWTDGYREGSLMPNDQGLRQCKCGNFYLLSELQWISQVEETDAPYTKGVSPDELPQAIAQARTPEIEIAARLCYWQHLNHDYRERYRAHRDAEEAATKAAWRLANPDLRSWWQKFRKAPTLQYVKAADSPFTYPPFEPTDEQRANMKALLQLVPTSESHGLNLYEIAELHRELGEFEQAAYAMQQIPEDDETVTQQVMHRLINEKEIAPMRYRM